MADQRGTVPPCDASPKSTLQPPPPPVYSRWRTAAHLYLPFVTVGLFMTFGSPFETTEANLLCVVLSAIPTNWLGSFFYPNDRPEPTPEQAVRFSRKSDIYRAAILFTYRWLFGTPFDLMLFIREFLMSYTIGSVIGERPAGTKQRRSAFATCLPWVIGSSVLVYIAPSFLEFWLMVLDRVLWRTAYIALVDDIIGVLARPNLETWKGKVVLVLTQAFTITFTCWMLLRWKRDLILALQLSELQEDSEYKAAIETLIGGKLPGEVDFDASVADIEDDGDRFLV